MNFQRVRAIITKEILEIRKNRLLLSTIFLPPILFLIIPVGIVATAGNAVGNTNLPPGQLERFRELSPEFASLSPAEFFQVVILQQFLIFFLLIPLIIPASIASFSIIGEKEFRSLEPLLATPVRTSELLLGKGIAAVLPAVLTTWITYILFLVAIRVLVASNIVFGRLIDPMWLLAMILLAPLLSLLSVSLGIIVSSRVNDVRVAQQLVGIIVVPVVLLGVGQTVGVILLNTVTFLAGALVIALIDIGVIYIGTRLFQREVILTRWK